MKTNSTLKNIPFNGGNIFTQGRHKLYHDMFMLNELTGGVGGYILDYAEGKSGLTYGGNQMDLGGGENKYCEDFIKIMKANQITCDDEFERKMRLKGKKPAEVFGNLLPRINAALSSPYGQQIINEAYHKKIKECDSFVDKVLKLIEHPDPRVKQFYHSDLGRLLIIDYDNQYKLKLNKDKGKFIRFINGIPQLMDNFKPIEASISPDNVLSSHLQYILSTQQAKNSESTFKDLIRRLSNDINLYNNYANQKIEVTWPYYRAHGNKSFPNGLPPMEVRNFNLNISEPDSGCCHLNPIN